MANYRFQRSARSGFRRSLDWQRNLVEAYKKQSVARKVWPGRFQYVHYNLGSGSGSTDAGLNASIAKQTYDANDSVKFRTITLEFERWFLTAVGSYQLLKISGTITRTFDRRDGIIVSESIDITPNPVPNWGSENVGIFSGFASGSRSVNDEGGDTLGGVQPDSGGGDRNAYPSPLDWLVQVQDYTAGGQSGQTLSAWANDIAAGAVSGSATVLFNWGAGPQTKVNTWNLILGDRYTIQDALEDARSLLTDYTVWNDVQKNYSQLITWLRTLNDTTLVYGPITVNQERPIDFDETIGWASLFCDGNAGTDLACAVKTKVSDPAHVYHDIVETKQQVMAPSSAAYPTNDGHPPQYIGEIVAANALPGGIYEFGPDDLPFPHYGRAVPSANAGRLRADPSMDRIAPSTDQSGL